MYPVLSTIRARYRSLSLTALSIDAKILSLVFPLMASAYIVDFHYTVLRSNQPSYLHRGLHDFVSYVVIFKAITALFITQRGMVRDPICRIYSLQRGVTRGLATYHRLDFLNFATYYYVRSADIVCIYG